jgi:hypothetical protein
MRKFLIKLFSTDELKKEILKREFINDAPNLDFGEIKNLWQKIFKENPKIIDFIKFRKNQLLYSLISGDSSNKDDIARVISEWSMIESLSQDYPDYIEVKEEEPPKDIESIFEKLKGRFLNK